MSSKVFVIDGVDFTFTDCITCGVRYALPSAMYNHQAEKGGFHHCPNNHSQGWTKEESLLARARRERDIAQQQIARVEDETREALAKLDRAQQETKRLKKRVSVGTCPCCQRTFSNMARHMKQKHPAYAGANVVKLKVS